ncbi:FAD-dependent tricarballylate dehydrogenase TcuA [Actinophytocola sp.]|uniref:FAD-dependent tricarballylate dehydrogenase TcuA n=1 Tax=Actinophytocola sp. TaxID=1872138 RepID=UPI003D6B605D
MASSDAEVVVVGGGNAGMCAAIAAADAGRKVLLVEWAPEERRGGNTFYTGGGVRIVHDGLDDVLKLAPDSIPGRDKLEIEPYTEQQYFDDIARVTEYRSDPELLEAFVAGSRSTIGWLADLGMRFDLAYGRHSVVRDGRRRFFGGTVLEYVDGGQGIVEGMTKLAEQHGVDISYRTRLTGLELDERGHVCAVRVSSAGTERTVRTRSIVLACGGFEANPAMRAQYLGPGWDIARHRGTEYNRGDGLRLALEIGADPYGHWSGCHAVQWDANAPLVRDRAVPHGYERESYPIGVVVNQAGERFVDEGANFFPYTYAKYGRAIMGQPGQVAHQIFDAKTRDLLLGEYRQKETTKVVRDTIPQLARALEVDVRGLEETIRRFNEAVLAGEFDPTSLDGKATEGITPVKSNWAVPIDTPPYLAFPVTVGVTFTFGGLRVNDRAQVLDAAGSAIGGLYAAGEIVGGIFYHNYAGGTGLVSGAVLGRTAGLGAAELAAAS